jgi:hypothetical protein
VDDVESGTNVVWVDSLVVCSLVVRMLVDGCKVDDTTVKLVVSGVVLLDEVVKAADDREVSLLVCKVDCSLVVASRVDSEAVETASVAMFVNWVVEAGRLVVSIVVVNAVEGGTKVVKVDSLVVCSIVVCRLVVGCKVDGTTVKLVVSGVELLDEVVIAADDGEVSLVVCTIDSSLVVGSKADSEAVVTASVVLVMNLVVDTDCLVVSRVVMDDVESGTNVVWVDSLVVCSLVVWRLVVGCKVDETTVKLVVSGVVLLDEVVNATDGKELSLVMYTVDCALVVGSGVEVAAVETASAVLLVNWVVDTD